MEGPPVSILLLASLSLLAVAAIVTLLRDASALSKG